LHKIKAFLHNNDEKAENFPKKLNAHGHLAAAEAM